ncbi:MAG: hypothetical protein JSU73_04895 [candidate division WOR-3 bacterium]|nr:MAG: hypothetical protein JSU73_04895 [candidate division WOR-3 bacterium]
MARFGLLALVLLASCSQVKRLHRADFLTPEDRLDYAVLASLSAEHAAQYLAQGSGPARAEYLDWFWDQSPFAAGLPEENARQTYHERAVKAREFFGQTDLLGDDRVKTYIRYGPPQRETFEPEPVRDETLVIIVNPAEIWTYEELGRQIDFVKTGVAYKQVGETRFGPDFMPPFFAQVDLGRPRPSLREDALPLDLEVVLGRYQLRGDTVETEVHFGIPMRRLAPIAKDNRLPELFFRLDFRPRGNSPEYSRRFWATPSQMPDTTRQELVVGREVFQLVADVYEVTILALASGGSASGEKKMTLNLVDYVRRAQPGSDIMLYQVADSTFQTPEFSRGNWQRLVPMVRPEVTSGQSFYVMYELYNLGQDEEGSHRVEADYEMYEQASRHLAVVPSPPRFILGQGPTATVVERVHTMDLRPSNYVLVCRVKDRERGRDISLTSRFRILPRP